MRLLHFTAEWCGPCKMMKPVIDSILEGRDDIEYVSIDIDTNQETAIDYGVMSIPAFILVDDDYNIVSYVRGAMPKDKFLDALGI